MNALDLGVIAITHVNDHDEESISPAKHGESFAARKKRVRQELIAAGMTPYGLSKFNTRYLTSIIKEGEHIHGVVYGRHVEGPGFLSWVDRMIVATDHRIISFNHKPGYTDDDEITYDVVNGVDSSNAWPFTAVTLDTRIGKVTLRFVRNRCAAIFIEYVERRRVEFFKTRTHRDLQQKEGF